MLYQVNSRLHRSQPLHEQTTAHTHGAELLCTLYLLLAFVILIRQKTMAKVNEWKKIGFYFKIRLDFQLNFCFLLRALRFEAKQAKRSLPQNYA